MVLSAVPANGSVYVPDHVDKEQNKEELMT
jgi:hypothetical protein